MARPNNAEAIAAKVKGLREAKAAFQAMPEAARDYLNAATEMTVREIVRMARAKLQSSPSIQTRNLYNHVTWSMNRKNGRGRAGVSTGTTTIRNPQIGGTGRRTVRVTGIIMPGRNGGAQGARLDKPSRRAHFVEFGTRRMKAEPFMLPAAEGEQQPFLSRCKGVGKFLEGRLAQIGGGGRTL